MAIVGALFYDSLTSRDTCELGEYTLVRWLALLVFALTLFLGFEGNEPAAAHRHGAVAVWSLDSHSTNWSVDACDDDDQDDSAPPSPGSAPGSDEDVLVTGQPIRLHAGVVLLSFRPEPAGLRPARGHARGLEHPPESRLIRLES